MGGKRQKIPSCGLYWNFAIRSPVNEPTQSSSRGFRPGMNTSLMPDGAVHPSMIATALVQPAEARSILTGKQDTVKPVDGNCSRWCSFSMWQ